MKAIVAHPSPVGALTLVSNGTALTGCYFASGKMGEPPAPRGVADGVINEARRQLDSYFAGRRQSFDVPLAPQGTVFQTRVWAGLLQIPFGRTMSYGALAAHIGAPAAVRAVGAANGRNPLPIFIPCHRVIGANGSLTGFGGGMERKARLLELEQQAPLPLM